MRFSIGRSAAILAFAGLALTACGDEASNEESFFSAMTEQAGLTDEEANCMVNEIFNNSSLTGDQINEGSNDINGSSSSAFRNAFNTALEKCAGL